MRVLVACEMSGIVREAFRARGHDAWSCDIFPSEIPGNHYQEDILKVINNDWDLMIAHPPCTYLSVVGNRAMYLKGTDIIDYSRVEKRNEAKEFFMTLYNAPIPHIAVENPMGYINRFIQPDQVIHPYYFGEPIMKRTCLWLKNLPLLNRTDWSHKPKPLYELSTNGKKIGWTEGAVRTSIDRSRTFIGIANAMAEQWGQINGK
jgi:hypothetical protein